MPQVDITEDTQDNQPTYTIVTKRPNSSVITYTHFIKHPSLSKEDQDKIADELDQFAETKQQEEQNNEPKSEEQLQREKELQQK
jgi:hypothetical protein